MLKLRKTKAIKDVPNLKKKTIEKMNDILSINKCHSFEKPGFKH